MCWSGWVWSWGEGFMMRILFDELGGSHNDIILKIDTSPNFMQVADTYYLYEFLDIKADEKIDVIIGFINYFKNEILSLNDETRFIAFDLSDQYVGGIFVSESKKGLVKVEYGFSKKIAGYGTNLNVIANQVDEHRESFEIENQWEISINSIIEGLDWSKRRVENL